MAPLASAALRPDYKFASASAAASVVMGQPASGAAYWKTISGQTYKEWERARVGGDVSSPP